MKVIALNGSPRKKWNTATLLKHALDGAASKGADTELVHLYDYNYKGCIISFWGLFAHLFKSNIRISRMNPTRSAEFRLLFIKEISILPVAFLLKIIFRYEAKR